MRDYSNNIKNKHLCFVFIPKYKCLENTGLCFDDRYAFDFNGDTLNIGRNNNHIENLWGRNIYSLSALVGENGAGKSTAIRYIMETLVLGYTKDVAEGVFVVEEDGELKVYTKKKINIVSTDNINAKYGGDSFAIGTFFYSSHFSVPSNSSVDIRAKEIGGLSNGSDFCRLTDDFAKYCKSESSDLQQAIQNHIIGYNSQNECRIAMLLAHHHDLMDSFGLNPPRYVCIVPNISGRTALYTKHTFAKDKNRSRIPDVNTINGPNSQLKDYKKQTLFWFVYHMMLNMATDGVKLKRNIVNFLVKWMDSYKEESLNDSNFYEKFDEFSGKHIRDDIEKDKVRVVRNVLTSIENLCELSDYGEFYIDITKEDEKLLELINYTISNKIFLTARFFDMTFCHNLDKNDQTFLSSGELEMLNLYSRINDAVFPERLHSEKNTSNPTLLILDEAEVGYHPDWQRRFVNNVVTFLNILDVEEDSFQVILTSHSPIILSDIPKSCTNYLTKGRPKPQEETFGSNVFDLYRSSFFMYDGLIGEYALKIITEARETLQNHNDNSDNHSRTIKTLENARKVIMSIGDNEIKRFLLHELSEYDIQCEIEHYTQTISDLEKQLRKDE